ncbi:MAG: S9 family peptidase [Chloroflexi bacterium]|nr:MAG: S9 family peptidase [Chloroflexota bacterium]MBL1193912.1 S9 family peptidase [Chloroflexota bacterium]NOH11206.1 S9 family peptidase [Chloroflexota bacterium]
MARIESFLSARLFLQPQLVGQKIYFMSNLSGHLSLYVMDHGGSVPQPLLPPNIALQNPHLIDGKSFHVFPKLGRIIVNVDHDGDENYVPMTIPLEGGFPEPAFGDFFDDKRASIGKVDDERSLMYIMADSRNEAINYTYRANVETGEITEMFDSGWGAWVVGANKTHDKAVILEFYTVGDNSAFLWDKATGKAELLYGVPLEQRKEGQEVPLTSFGSSCFTADDKGLLFFSSIFQDTYGPTYLTFDAPDKPQEVTVTGHVHTGSGEFYDLEHIKADRYLMYYNIDGCTWVYEAEFDEAKLEMRLGRVLVGGGQFSNGVLEALTFDEDTGRYALAFSTATSPTQIHTIEGDETITHTSERILGISDKHLSPGEDASFTSFDGLRISARLYLPASDLGYEEPRPLVYYVHGGPQAQERPDFAWFSMPLIQFLTMRGFAVFVPNVRGSEGYGLEYMKKVDRDWGGDDAKDHVHAMTEFLSKDPRVDIKRAGVVGRSYGGYMTLFQAGYYSELWSAAVDMFGPYDLLTFGERIPPSWKPYFKIALGDPVEDRDFLIERSPKTHLHQLACPMLVIQGKNDPRVVEQESRDLVEELRGQGKEIDYLMFEDEGHDVLKYDNRVTCYNAITKFFEKHL